MDEGNKRVVEGARLSAEGHPNGTLVEFDQDVFPHVVGDVKRLDKEELKRVDARAKANGLKGTVYHDHKLSDEEKEAVKRDHEAAAKAAEAPAK